MCWWRQLAAVGVQVAAMCWAGVHVLGKQCCVSHHGNLKALKLDYAVGSVEGTSYLSGDLCTALQRLTQLTSLQLNVGRFKYMPGTVKLNTLFEHLPSSTAEFGIDIIHGSSLRCPFLLHTSSMCHLTALRHLALPGSLVIDSQEEHGNLGPLTALTSLVFPGAVDQPGRALLALPNLVKIKADTAHPECLQQLAAKTTLRHLECCLETRNVPTSTGAAALKRLTQLTALSLGLPSGTVAVVGPTRVAVGAAVAALTGLQQLALQPEVLERMPIAALTALTQVVIDATRRGQEQAYGQKRIKKLVSKLAPAKGRLKVVQVVGAERPKQELWSAAVAAALGNVWVAFL
jgi:hypothetical protein